MEATDTVIIIIVASVFLIILLSYISFGRNVARKARASGIQQGILEARGLDFKKDIEFLLYFIGWKVDGFISFYLNPAEMANGDSILFNDKVLEEPIKSITADVINAISPSYRIIMSRYFAPGALEEFIAEQVMRQLKAVAAQKNAPKLARMTGYQIEEI